MPPPGGAAVPPVRLPQPAGVPGATPPAPLPATAPAPGFSDPGFPMPPPGGGLPVQDPGFSMPSTQSMVGIPGDQRQGFAALDALRAQYQPQPAPQIDPSGGLDPMTGGIGIPPALQRAQIASTPPWRLDPLQLDALVQQHGADTVFGWPGQSLLGAG